MTNLQTIGRRLAVIGVLALTISLLPFAAAFAQPAPDDNQCEGGVDVPRGPNIGVDSPDDTGDDNFPIELPPGLIDNPGNPNPPPFFGDTPDDTGDDTFVVDLDASTNSEASVVSSQFTFECADAALIARDDIFPDALSSGPLQGLGRPLLLTATDALNQEVEAELDRLGVEHVTILGDTNAISAGVQTQLEEDYTVNRLGGVTRVETAIQIADQFQDADTAILARSHEDPSTGDQTQAFADSIAAGGWAAENQWPVLLTYPPVDDDPATPDIDESELGASLLDTTRSHIESAGYERIIIVGGEAAIGAEVQTELEGLVDTVERVGGATRFETAVDIAEARGFTDSSDAEFTILAEGQGGDAWVDGFTAAALSGLTPAPIVLANSAAEDLPQPTLDFLVEASPEDGLDDGDVGNGDFGPDSNTSLQDQGDRLAGVCYPKVPDAPGTEEQVDDDATFEFSFGQCGEMTDELGADAIVSFPREDDGAVQ